MTATRRVRGPRSSSSAARSIVPSSAIGATFRTAPVIWHTQLPGHDVRVMFQLGDDDLIAGTKGGATEAGGDKVDRLGCTTHENHFIGTAGADEMGNGRAGLFVGLCGGVAVRGPLGARWRSGFHRRQSSHRGRSEVSESWRRSQARSVGRPLMSLASVWGNHDVLPSTRVSSKTDVPDIKGVNLTTDQFLDPGNPGVIQGVRP